MELEEALAELQQLVLRASTVTASKALARVRVELGRQVSGEEVGAGGSSGEEWWTFEQTVKAIGKDTDPATWQWLRRRGLKAVRMYRADEVRAEIRRWEGRGRGYRSDLHDRDEG